MTTEIAYITEKFVDIEVLENFVPLLNKKGQAKLAFVEVVPGLIEKDGEELAKLQFRFICEGVNGSRVITYTGWLRQALSEGSSLGRIMKGFGVVNFHTPDAVTVDEFDFDNNFKSAETSDNTLKFEELLAKLSDLEGTIVLAELTKDKGVWLRPDPESFDFPRDKKDNFYKTDISSFKKN
jgi:hypothetical protein